MTAVNTATPLARRRLPFEMFGGWEVGLIVFMILIYLVGVYINPRFFGGTEALSSVLRDAARYGVMAVGMTFVIVNKDLDLSVGSLYGVTAVVFSVAFSQSYFDAGLFALVSIGLTFVIANGDIDLSVGSVLAMSGAIAAFSMKTLGFDPWTGGRASHSAAACLPAPSMPSSRSVSGCPPSSRRWACSTSPAASPPGWSPGRAALGFPESYNLIGRKLIEVAALLRHRAGAGLLAVRRGRALSDPEHLHGVLAIIAGIVLGKTIIGLHGLRHRRQPAGRRICRHRHRPRPVLSLVFSALCASLAGLIYIAYFRSFNPSAGQLRELDVIAAVIIGGASIFGGYGTIIGALAGAAVITLLRALLSLQIIPPDGSSFVLPQHWVNVFIGLILIVAVLGDIWLRQEGSCWLDPRLHATSATDGARKCLTRHATAPRRDAWHPEGFGAVRALADVELRLDPGEILGLVGDNSAGKSTLMKIMTGAYQRDRARSWSTAQPTTSRARTRAARSGSR